MQKALIDVMLSELGFIAVTHGLMRTGEQTQGFRHGSALKRRGSIYANAGYLSATGSYRRLEEFVAPSSLDPKGYPEWKGAAIEGALDALKLHLASCLSG